MRTQTGALIFTDMYQNQKMRQGSELDDFLSEMNVVKPEALINDLAVHFQEGSGRPSCFFMDYRYRDYASIGKGRRMMPVYGVKGTTPGITRKANYVELLFAKESDLAGKGFHEQIFGTAYLSGEDTVNKSDQALVQEIGRPGAVSPLRIASDHMERICRIMTWLWKAQEQDPSTRFVIVMSRAAEMSIDILRELFMLIPDRLRLQLGFETNIDEVDIDRICESGLPIYILTAESRFSPESRSWSFPVVLCDWDRVETLPCDESRLVLVRSVASVMNEEMSVRLGKAEKVVLGRKESYISSFKYYEEVVKSVFSNEISDEVSGHEAKKPGLLRSRKKDDKQFKREDILTSSEEQPWTVGLNPDKEPLSAVLSREEEQPWNVGRIVEKEQLSSLSSRAEEQPWTVSQDFGKERRTNVLPRAEKKYWDAKQPFCKTQPASSPIDTKTESDSIIKTYKKRVEALEKEVEQLNHKYSKANEENCKLRRKLEKVININKALEKKNQKIIKEKDVTVERGEGINIKKVKAGCESGSLEEENNEFDKSDEQFEDSKVSRDRQKQRIVKILAGKTGFFGVVGISFLAFVLIVGIIMGLSLGRKNRTQKEDEFSGSLFENHSNSEDTDQVMTESEKETPDITDKDDGSSVSSDSNLTVEKEGTSVAESMVAVQSTTMGEFQTESSEEQTVSAQFGSNMDDWTIIWGDAPSLGLGWKETSDRLGEPAGYQVYYHLRFAADNQGNDLTEDTSLPYIGVYVSGREQDTDEAQYYQWREVSSIDSANGIRAEWYDAPDIDYYLHIAYAADQNGSDFSVVDPTGRACVGYYISGHDDNGLSPDSDNYSDYTWYFR